MAELSHLDQLEAEAIYIIREVITYERNHCSCNRFGQHILPGAC